MRFGHSQYKEIEKADSVSMDHAEAGDAPSLPVTEPISVDVSDQEEEEEEDEEEEEEKEEEEENEEEEMSDSAEEFSGDESSPNYKRRTRNRKWLLENKQSQSREQLTTGGPKQNEDSSVQQPATGRISRRRASESASESILDRAIQIRARRDSAPQGSQSGADKSGLESEDIPLRPARRTRRNSAPAEPTSLPLEEPSMEVSTTQSQQSEGSASMKRVKIFLFEGIVDILPYI